MTTNLDAVPDGAHGALPSMVQVRRSDPVYMAHACLTKVPLTAIAPFIEAFTEPGDVVLDPFAGSGMTGIAALVTGRRAVLYDVSVLGRHIGSNYVNLVDADLLRERGECVERRARGRIGDVYAVVCDSCRGGAQLAKSVWSAVIFYSDMSLFQEAWLDATTAPGAEAVVDRGDTGGPRRTAERYEAILTGAFKECRRVLKPGGHITVLFGNSSGAMWQLLQRAVGAAGLEVAPELIAVLDKGQRSVKGLASGFENVATLDLILTLRSASHPLAPCRHRRSPPSRTLSTVSWPATLP